MNMHELQTKIKHIFAENLHRDALIELNMLATDDFQEVLNHIAAITTLLRNHIEQKDDSILWLALLNIQDAAMDIHDERTTQK